jgi:hypothetical protein
MRTTLWRWLLAPRTSWHAWRLMRIGDDRLSFDTAWRRARVDLHPDEMPYREYGHLSERRATDDTRAPWH